MRHVYVLYILIIIITSVFVIIIHRLNDKNKKLQYSITHDVDTLYIDSIGVAIKSKEIADLKIINKIKSDYIKSLEKKLNLNSLLNEKYEVIYNIWNWLINEASSELILKHKDFFAGQDISQIDLDKAHKDLIGFCINRGSIVPKSIVQKWSCQVASKPNWASTTAFSLQRIAKLLPEIKHWKTQIGDYKNLPDIEATWFIDPPYQFGGEHYSVNGIDYSELGIEPSNVYGTKMQICAYDDIKRCEKILIDGEYCVRLRDPIKTGLKDLSFVRCWWKKLV